MKKEFQAGTKDEQRTAADFSTSASVEANPMLPAVAARPIRNFNCELPKDFYQLLSIELMRKPKSFIRRSKDGTRKVVTFNCNLKLPFITEMEQMRYLHSCYADNKMMFMLKEDKVIFSGSYSKWQIIKWFQKLKEKIKPKIAIIKYIDFQTALNSDVKLRERYAKMQDTALRHIR